MNFIRFDNSPPCSVESKSPHPLADGVSGAFGSDCSAYGLGLYRFSKNLESGPLMVMLVQSVDRKVTILAGSVNSVFHGRLGERPGAGFV